MILFALAVFVGILCFNSFVDRSMSVSAKVLTLLTYIALFWSAGYLFVEACRWLGAFIW